jgi:hypothetical protein
MKEEMEEPAATSSSREFFGSQSKNKEFRGCTHQVELYRCNIPYLALSAHPRHVRLSLAKTPLCKLKIPDAMHVSSVPHTKEEECRLVTRLDSSAAALMRSCDRCGLRFDGHRGHACRGSHKIPNYLTLLSPLGQSFPVKKNLRDDQARIDGR